MALGVRHKALAAGFVVVSAAALAAGCAGQRVEPGVDPGAVSRVVGDVMSAQARIGADEKLRALADLEAFLVHTNLKSERVARALTQLANLYLTIELNTYARDVRVIGEDAAVVRHDHSVPLYRKVLADYPERPGNDAVYYQLARAYDDLGDTASEARALGALAERTRSGARAAEARYRLGELAFDDGRFGDAAGYYAAALKAGAEGRVADLAAYKRAWALYLVPDEAAAATAAVAFLDFKRVPRGGGLVLDSGAMPEPDWERVREVAFILARMLHARGGVSALERTVPEGRDYRPMIYHQLGEVAAQTGDLKGAVATFEAYIRRHPDAPDVPDFLKYMVEAYTDERDLKAAVAVRERLVEGYGPGTRWWGRQSASTRRAMGPVLRQTNFNLARHYHSVAQESKRPADYARAADAYRRYLVRYPDGAEAGEADFLLGEVLFEAGNFGAAAAAYRASAYDAPAHRRAAEAAYAAVFARERLLAGIDPGDPAYDGRLEALVADFADLVRAYPREPRLQAAYERISGLLFERKDYARLYDLTDQVIRFGPRNRSLHVRAWRVLGESALETGRLERADAALGQALEYVKDDPVQVAEIRKLLAASAASRADAPGVTDAEAADWLLKAAALVDPADPLARSARVDAGLALVRAGEEAKALAVFGAFLKDHPEDPQRDRIAQAVVQMGQDALARGDAPAARMAWDRYLDWFAGESPERDRAIAAYQARTDLAAGNLESADRAFTAMVASYGPGAAPQETVDQLAGVRFKRAAALLKTGDAGGLDVLQSIADDLPASVVAPKALEALVRSAPGAGAGPGRAVAVAGMLMARYPDSDEAESVRGTYPDLLVAAGREVEAARYLVERAEDVRPAEARALLERAAGLFEANGEPEAAADALETLRDGFEAGSDPWVAAEMDVLKLDVAGTTRFPDGVGADRAAALGRTLDERVLAVLEPLAEADRLGAEGRKAAADIWLAKADAARDRYAAVALVPPFKENLAAKQAALKEALAALGKAAAFRSRDATLNATRQTGDLLEDFARALVDSPTPAQLTEAQVPIYREGLAKRARPYLERAVRAHEQNLERAREGLTGPDVQASVRALGRLRPEWYDRPEAGVRPIDVP